MACGRGETIRKSWLTKSYRGGRARPLSQIRRSIRFSAADAGEGEVPVRRAAVRPRAGLYGNLRRSAQAYVEPVKTAGSAIIGLAEAGSGGHADQRCVRAGRCRAAAAGVLAVISTVAAFAGAARAPSLEELRNLSIEDLANVEVTSVSLRREPLSEAPAAIYVIRGEDIRRSGAVSLPEALRLAPNLEVARVSSQTYVISARGFNSPNASNKLLVLIDGRSVYTPFFSSVFWDQQQVMLDDIDRIEVISGPGGTTYGANAVNGVINIITKSSRDTQGGLLDLKYGSFDKSGAGRWGGKLGDAGTYRAYALGFGLGHTDLPDGTSASDDWNGKQAGFRSDFAALGSALTIQGDVYENRLDTPGGRLSGGNFLGRWTKQLGDGSSLQVQSYYDRQDRHAVPGVESRTNTFDIQAQHDFRLGTAHEIVWGLGERVVRDRFQNTLNVFVLEPAGETLTLTNIFAQDTIALSDDLKLTLGTKLEYNTFSGFEYLPSGRLGWRASPTDFFWGAISRVVRTPSRLDRELQAPGILAPAPNFRSEKLIAYEAGYRAQPIPQASLSISLFYNQYDDLRTTSLSPSGGLPTVLANGLAGDTYGFEVWGDYSVAPWWRLSPGLQMLRKRLHLKPGATDIAGIQTSTGQDPGHQAFLRSYMTLPHDVEFDVDLRQVGSLGGVSVPSYFEADVRFGWHVTPDLELSLAGLNLVHAHHAEASTPPPLEIPRSVYAGVRWRF
jgi:iron complex outermembrane recepter protein